VDAVPPALAWRLRPVEPDRRAPRSHARWPLGAAFATAAVLAIAVGLRPHGAGPSQTMRMATASAAGVSADDATATLDRNPDFYAWLASPDAEQLAME
jgi:hypothetical protein